MKQRENWALIEGCSVVYSAGFFIPISPDTALSVARHCAENDKVYCLVSKATACVAAALCATAVIAAHECSADSLFEALSAGSHGLFAAIVSAL